MAKTESQATHIRARHGKCCENYAKPLPDLTRAVVANDSFVVSTPPGDRRAFGSENRTDRGPALATYEPRTIFVYGSFCIGRQLLEDRKIDRVSVIALVPS